MKRLMFALFFSVATAATAAESPTIAITDVTIVHPQRDEATALETNQTIIVRLGRIVWIGPAIKATTGRNTLTINGQGRYVVPGLIDSHVHFSQSGNLYTRPDAADFNKSVPYLQEDARNKARLAATFRVWLASGVTSVIDLGGPMWNFKMRDRALSSNAAPRVAVAGPLISMVDDPFTDPSDSPIIKATTSEQARAEVARQLPNKPDFIKVWFIHKKGDDLAAQEATVKAAGDAAHAAGIRFAVHATELAVAKAALRAGADFLVHSVTDQPVDDEFIALAKKNKAIYAPTLFVFTSYGLALSDTWSPTEAEKRLADPEILQSMGDLKKMPKELIPPRVQKLMAEPPSGKVPEVAMQNLVKVWRAGIPVVMGTDAGNIGTLHGPSVFREMQLMREAGLTPLEVLRSATVNGAKALGQERDLGAIEPGRLADLLVLEANPLTDLGNLSRIHRVIRDGRAYTQEELLRGLATTGRTRQ